MSTGCGDQGVGPEKRVVDVVARPAGRPPRFGGEGGSVHDELRAEMLRLMDDEEEPSCLDEPARRLLREARDNFVRMGLGTRRLVRSGSTTHPPEALAAAVLNKESEKYDGFLDESLLSAEYARRNLDAEGEWRAVESIVRSGEGDP